jgi:hypothetical protein
MPLDVQALPAGWRAVDTSTSGSGAAAACGEIDLISAATRPREVSPNSPTKPE